MRGEYGPCTTFTKADCSKDLHRCARHLGCCHKRCGCLRACMGHIDQGITACVTETNANEAITDKKAGVLACCRHHACSYRAHIVPKCHRMGAAMCKYRVGQPNDLK